MKINNRILIAPYARTHDHKKVNAKDYPYMNSLVKKLSDAGYRVSQIGVEGEPAIIGVENFYINQPIKKIPQLLKEHSTFISVDTFLQHIAALHSWRGFVIWGMSDPEIFGHEMHCNIVKSKEYFRANQYNVWMNEEPKPDAFLESSIVFDIFQKYYNELTQHNSKLLVKG